MEDEEEKIISRDTLIIEFIKDNKKFICNRNSDTYKYILNNNYISFWEINEACKLVPIKNWNIITTLKGVDNYNKRHQNYINSIKKKYIKNAIEANENIINVQFAKVTKEYFKFYKNQYDKFIDELDNINNLYYKIYDMSKRLFYKKNNIEYLNKTFWEIWNDERMSYEQRVLVIMLRDYIRNAKKNGLKKPYNKGNIKTTINLIINKFY